VSPVELVVLAVSQSRRRVARGLHSTRYTIAAFLSPTVADVVRHVIRGASKQRQQQQQLGEDPSCSGCKQRTS